MTTYYNYKTKQWIAEKPKEIKHKDVEAIVGKVKTTIEGDILIIEKDLSPSEKTAIEAL